MSPKPCSRPRDMSQVQKAGGESMRHGVLGAEPEAGMDSGITVHLLAQNTSEQRGSEHKRLG